MDQVDQGSLLFASMLRREAVEPLEPSLLRLPDPFSRNLPLKILLEHPARSHELLREICTRK